MRITPISYTNQRKTNKDNKTAFGAATVFYNNFHLVIKEQIGERVALTVINKLDSAASFLKSMMTPKKKDFRAIFTQDPNQPLRFNVEADPNLVFHRPEQVGKSEIILKTSDNADTIFNKVMRAIETAASKVKD